MERICCACRVEKDAGPVAFPAFKTTYFLGPLCHGAWRLEAMALGPWLNNNARVYTAFTKWLDTRRVVA